MKNNTFTVLELTNFHTRKNVQVFLVLIPWLTRFLLFQQDVFPSLPMHSLLNFPGKFS